MLDLNLVHVDQSSFSKKRKLGPGACKRCHERKVKCDAGPATERRGPCSNCVASGDICRSHVDGRSRNNAQASVQRDLDSTGWPSQNEPLSGISQDTASLRGDLSTSGLVLTTPPSEDDAGGLPWDSNETMGTDDIQGEQHYPVRTMNFTSVSATHTHRSLDSEVEDSGNSRSTGSLRNDISVITGHLSPPYASAQVPAEPPVVPSVPLDRFEAYVRDTLGAYAPSFQGQKQRASTNNHQIQGQVGSQPTFTNSTASWDDQGYLESTASLGAVRPLDVNMSLRSTLDLEQQVTQLDSADMEYLKAKGAFDLPPRKLQEDLVEVFFLDVHPTAPVVNRADFLSTFYSNGNPSRLLLFAIFTSASRACRNPALLDNRGTNQGSAQRFYKATKALLDTGYERNHLVRIQALLLLTWWWDKKDDGGRNMRSCSVDAINTAQSLGMHRWDHYPKDDIVLARLWKRIWWTCFNRDVAVAVSHGLPCILSLTEFDVQPLSADDFNEEPSTPVHLQRWGYKPVEVSFSIQVIKVAETLHHIHTACFVTQSLQQTLTKSISQRESHLSLLRQAGQQPLPPGVTERTFTFSDDYNDHGIQLCRQWLEELPDLVKYDPDDVQGHEFWPGFLHVLYLTNVMLRYRQKAVLRPTNGRTEAERQYCQTRGIAAATMISKILRNARAHNHILRFTGQLTISLYNCMIFFLIEGQSPRDEVQRDAKSKYSQCLHILYEFSQLWVSASLTHRLFETLQAHMQISKSVASAGVISSSASTSSFFATEPSGTPLPGLRVSSNITMSHLQELLATDFYYDDCSTTGTGLSLDPSNGLDSNLSFPGGVNQFFLEDDAQPSPDFSLPLGAGAPDSVDIARWIDFFGLGEGTTAEDSQFMYGDK